MPEFNRMTIVAAAEVIADSHSHSDIDVIEIEWNLSRRGGGSKSARTANLANGALEETDKVHTEAGLVTVERALIDRALASRHMVKDDTYWRRFKAGLRFDGFEVVEPVGDDDETRWGGSQTIKPAYIVRMLPDDLPGLKMREAESEVIQLLRKHRLTVAEGHLARSISAFQRGEWSGANGELRNFLESYLNEIADKLGCPPGLDSKQKRDFLGADLEPPFLLAEYNEWNSSPQKGQYVQGLMSRMHPHGGHPGLSEEEDATFRLQVNLVTARFFLRRLDRGAY